MWTILFVVLACLVFSGQVLHHHFRSTAALYARLAEQEHRLRALDVKLSECSHAFQSVSHDTSLFSQSDWPRPLSLAGGGGGQATALLDCRLALSAAQTDRQVVLLQQQVDMLTRQLVNLDPGRRRRFRRLVYVIPFITAHVPRLQQLFSEHWAKYRPCDPANPSYASYTDLMLYANRVLGNSDDEHQALADALLASLRRHGLDQCFGSISVQIANFSSTADPETYQRKPIADQFFQVYQAEAARRHYHYLAYMEPDTMPIRPDWLTRLYEEVEFGPEFWIKGSMYRGPAGPLEFCYSVCGCAEHMNGNAVYALDAPPLANFLASVHRKMDFLSYNFDAFIMNQLKALENWPFWQANAHRFQYTELLQHGQHYMHVRDIQAQFPATFLVHQAKYD